MMSSFRDLLIHTCIIWRRYAKQKQFYRTGTAAFTIGETVTGKTSKTTGVIDNFTLSSGTWESGNAAGYLILTAVSGTFQDGEDLISTSGSAIANGTNIDYLNPYKEKEWYWEIERNNVPCRFTEAFSSNQGYKLSPQGETILEQPSVFFDADITLGEGAQKLVTTDTGFAGIYKIDRILVKYNRDTLHHYEVSVIKEIG